jgi:hypothetical protein
MKLIATQTLTSDGPSITFSSIPQNFADLCVLISDRSSRPAGGINDSVTVKLNGVTSTGRRIYGNGSSATSDASHEPIDPAAGTTANTFSNIQIYIPNYSSTTQHKAWNGDSVMENNATLSYQTIIAGLYASNTAVSTLQFLPNQGPNFVAGTTISLYGVGGAGDGYAAPKATGGVISYSSGYIIHTFFSSGTFTPTTNLTDVEYLVIAGGGGGPTLSGGGGGAGGYRSSVTGESSGGGASAEAKLSLTSGTAYTVTVGAGGAGASSDPNRGSSGVDSTFASITSTGGGGGGYDTVSSGQQALNGGSGGGCGYGTGSGATGTANQGFNGGNSSGTGPAIYASAGGGGAGSVGGNASGTTGGNGGSGLTSSITGSAVARAGGGGGGRDVTGTSATAGGGAGGGVFTGPSAVSGTANTGGGGGGGRTVGGSGGSGIVVVRYLA